MPRHDAAPACLTPPSAGVRCSKSPGRRPGTHHGDTDGRSQAAASRLDRGRSPDAGGFLQRLRCHADAQSTRRHAQGGRTYPPVSGRTRPGTPGDRPRTDVSECRRQFRWRRRRAPPCAQRSHRRVSGHAGTLDPRVTVVGRRRGRRRMGPRLRRHEVRHVRIDLHLHVPCQTPRTSGRPPDPDVRPPTRRHSVPGVRAI